MDKTTTNEPNLSGTHDHPHTLVHGGEDHAHHDHEHPLERADLARIALVGIAIPLVWWLLHAHRPLGLAAGIIATLAGGWPIFKEALENVWARRMTMELSMTIALMAALAVGEFVTVLVIIFFVLIAEVIEGLTVGRGRKAIKHLVDLLPRQAILQDKEGARAVHTDQLKIGDVVLIKPGGNIPVDGMVVGGFSSVDQSAITGESLPVEKSAGMPVFAGTVNQSGALEVSVTGIGRDTAFGRIIEAVERAEKLRAPIQKTADRLAGYLVYFAIGCAALTFLITRDVYSTISVVIVAGACGIAAGTPLAILGAIGRAAHRGAIIKGGIHLEALGKVDMVVFDKTGTLTFGQTRVQWIRLMPGIAEANVVAAAALAERHSEHPLAQAVLAQAKTMGLPAVEPDRFEYRPGAGIVCWSGEERIVVGNRALLHEFALNTDELTCDRTPESVIFVARGARLLGAIGIADVVRPEARQAIAALHAMKIRTALLTGDSRPIAEAVARQLGIDRVFAELLPEQKVEQVRALLAQGRRVAMVGDGINDAPALMEASVGVAMGSGTDVARESADIVLIGQDLLKFSETVAIARWTRAIILTNFAGTLAVDSVGVGLAAFGMLNPLLAALIHVVSELLFIFNSARLLPASEKLGRARTKSPTVVPTASAKI